MAQENDRYFLRFAVGICEISPTFQEQNCVLSPVKMFRAFMRFPPWVSCNAILRSVEWMLIEQDRSTTPF